MILGILYYHNSLGFGYLGFCMTLSLERKIQEIWWVEFSQRSSSNSHKNWSYNWGSRWGNCSYNLPEGTLTLLVRIHEPPCAAGRCKLLQQQRLILRDALCLYIRVI